MRPLKAFISTESLIHNIQVLRAKAPHAKLCAIIKADAYGHRIESILPTALPLVDYLGVSCIDEAIEIRAFNQNLPQCPIVLLEGVFEANEYESCSQSNFIPVIGNQEQLDQLLNQSLQNPIDVFLKVDSGMHRIGIHPSEFETFYTALSRSKNVSSITLMTHFAQSDEPNLSATEDQLKVMSQLTHSLPKCYSNSAALFTIDHREHNIIRSGLSFYGISPFEDKVSYDLGLKPILSLQSKIIHTNRVPKGEKIGYGGIYTTSKETPVGIVACGYADGYPREVSNDAFVMINTYKAPIVGRVSMDMLAIDLSSVPEHYWDQEVLLFGESLPIEWVAKWANTVPYTILTHLARRIQFTVV